jgi:uncharacterized membrane protein YesL
VSGHREEDFGPRAPAVVRAAFLVRPPLLDAALVLLSTLSTLACLAPLFPPLLVVVAISLSPRSALWLRVDLVLRPTGLRD